MSKAVTETLLSSSDNEDVAVSRGDRKRKILPACSNCRQSHVACSHGQPCERCLKNGLEASCHYLPRKKRTNFRSDHKKRKADRAFDEDEHVDDANTPQSVNTSPPQGVPVGFDPKLSQEANILKQKDKHWTQMFGDEYPFPLVNSNPTLSATMQSIETVSSAEVFGQEAPSPPLQQRPNKVNNTINNYSSGTSIGQLNNINNYNYNQYNDNIRSANNWQNTNTNRFEPFLQQQQPIPSLSYQHPQQQQQQVLQNQQQSLIRELQEKNERLQYLLGRAMSDITELKAQEKRRAIESKLRMTSVYNPTSPFNSHLSTPAISVWCTTQEYGQLVQCNDAFKELVGHSWETLNTSFTCCSLYPRRSINSLVKRFQEIVENKMTYFDDDVTIVRGDGTEVLVRAFYHLVYGESKTPIYKMLYLFPIPGGVPQSYEEDDSGAETRSCNSINNSSAQVKNSPNQICLRSNPISSNNLMETDSQSSPISMSNSSGSDEIRSSNDLYSNNDNGLGSSGLSIRSASIDIPNNDNVYKPTVMEGMRSMNDSMIRGSNDMLLRGSPAMSDILRASAEDNEFRARQFLDPNLLLYNSFDNYS